MCTATDFKEVYDVGAEVCHLAYRVGLYGGLGVLHHYHAVLVVGVGDGESRLGQSVEECLFGVAIVLEGLVIVEVVAREVGEYASGEFQSANAFLVYGVRRALHEGVLASGLYHLAQELVQLYWVRCGVVGWYWLAVDIVAHGGQEATTVAELTEHII